MLIGLRGSGKSTLGTRLAHRRHAAFIDLDSLVTAQIGCASVTEAWARLGEPAFRAAEAQSLRTVLGRPSSVLSLGGGTPTAPGAADLLARAAVTIVYLRASAVLLRQRLLAGGVGDRPPLLPGVPGAAADPLSEIEAVFMRRDPLYLGLAHAVIEVDGLSLEQADAALDRIATDARAG